MTSDRLLLVDALSIAYRSFYAIPALATKAGVATNAVFGFIKTLRQVERLWKPTHGLVAFDGGRPVERLELLKAYKAQRPPMPDPLRAQLPLIERYLDAVGMAWARVEKEEADDLIATVADEGRRRSGDVLVATGDKDLMQLVADHVSLLGPGKAEVRIGPAEVFAKTGVTPSQIVDWLAMTGDTSDNIPGIPGVGPKTAAKWLQAWGTLDGVWEHLDALAPPKARQALEDHRDVVELNRRLTRLRADLPLPVPWEGLRRRDPDPQRLLAFFDEMEFHSLANELRAPMLGFQ